MAAKVKHVVADAGAFIRNAPLRDIAENVYTIPEVIAESCDRATRQRLKMLPIEMKFKEPSGDALLFVTSFAKKTGDYRSLSAVDLKVLALAYDLEKQFKGTKHIRQEPHKKPEWSVGGTTNSSGMVVAAKQYSDGEALPSNLIADANPTDSDSDDEEFYDAPQTLEDELVENGNANDNDKINTEDFTEQNLDENLDIDNKDMQEDAEDEENEEEEEDESDDEGWITPGNITDVKRTMGVETATVGDGVCVGCLTTDFAMQNVLIQMGLNVISVDGMLIKKAKSYVLRCFGCMRITKDTTKVFCPHCGNKTLKRLSTTIEEDGSVKYWLAKKFTIHTRGTKYSLPKPQGGKHGRNPILCGDQPLPDQRPTKKALQKVDILSDDIIEGMSPFRINDVTSKAAQLGIRDHHAPQWSKRNPNENRRRPNKRKGK